MLWRCDGAIVARCLNFSFDMAASCGHDEGSASRHADPPASDQGLALAEGSCGVADGEGGCRVGPGEVGEEPGAGGC